MRYPRVWWRRAAANHLRCPVASVSKDMSMYIWKRIREECVKTCARRWELTLFRAYILIISILSVGDEHSAWSLTKLSALKPERTLELSAEFFTNSFDTIFFSGEFFSPTFVAVSEWKTSRELVGAFGILCTGCDRWGTSFTHWDLADDATASSSVCLRNFKVSSAAPNRCGLGDADMVSLV